MTLSHLAQLPADAVSGPALAGVWSPVQTLLEVHDDQKVIANGYLQNVGGEDGGGFAVTTNPVQFDRTPPTVTRAPGHGEHTDAVLTELGFAYDEILGFKAEGAVL